MKEKSLKFHLLNRMRKVLKKKELSAMIHNDETHIIIIKYRVNESNYEQFVTIHSLTHQFTIILSLINDPLQYMS